MSATDQECTGKIEELKTELKVLQTRERSLLSEVGRTRARMAVVRAQLAHPSLASGDCGDGTLDEPIVCSWRLGELPTDSVESS